MSGRGRLGRKPCATKKITQLRAATHQIRYYINHAHCRRRKTSYGEICRLIFVVVSMVKKIRYRPPPVKDSF